MQRFRLRAALAAALISIPAVAAGAAAQSARQVLESSAERYEQRMKGIENYTIVQEVMGMENLTYFEKQMVDGKAVFLPRFSRVAGTTVPMEADESMSEAYAQFPQFAERAKDNGTEMVNGRSTRRIVLDDFTGLNFNPAAAGPQQEGAFTPQQMTMYIDTDEYLLRKMDIKGTMTVEGRTSPMNMTMTMDDYRSTNGLLHPWKTTMVTEGMMEASGQSPEEMAKARQQLAELEKQMQAMPASQREMMERMMGGQLASLRQMLESGKLEITMQVKDVRVNQGPPEQQG